MLKVATDCSGIGSPEQALHNLQIPQKTRLINIKINKKTEMCFKYFEKYYLVSKNPNK